MRGWLWIGEDGLCARRQHWGDTPAETEPPGRLIVRLAEASGR